MKTYTLEFDQGEALLNGEKKKSEISLDGTSVTIFGIICILFRGWKNNIHSVSLLKIPIENNSDEKKHSWMETKTYSIGISSLSPLTVTAPVYDGNIFRFDNDSVNPAIEGNYSCISCAWDPDDESTASITIRINDERGLPVKITKDTAFTLSFRQMNEEEFDRKLRHLFLPRPKPGVLTFEEAEKWEVAMIPTGILMIHKWLFHFLFTVLTAYGWYNYSINEIITLPTILMKVFPAWFYILTMSLFEILRGNNLFEKLMLFVANKHVVVKRGYALITDQYKNDIRPKKRWLYHTLYALHLLSPEIYGKCLVLATAHGNVTDRLGDDTNELIYE